MKGLLINTTSFVLKIITIIIKICIIALLIGFATQFVTNLGQYHSLNQLRMMIDHFSDPVTRQIKMAIPTSFHGVDLSKLIFVLLLLIINHFCETIRYKLRLVSSREVYDAWLTQKKSSLSEEKLSELDTKFKALNTAKKSDRKKLLAEFVNLKNQLDTMGQDLAFLAIDVVDSTGMKKDEDKHLASFAFEAYNRLVNDCLTKNGVIKLATTPDGIMSCFRTIDNAVNAAVNLLDRLKVFNKTENQIKRDFHVRCGINAGFVYIDNDTPLEQVSDRAIDIAGHMQKNAKPDTINIAASAIEPLKNRGGFAETTDVIDEQRVYEWTADKQSK